MKKITNIFLMIFSTFLCLFLLVSCGEKNENDAGTKTVDTTSNRTSESSSTSTIKQTYTIDFDSHGGNDVSSQYILEGNKINRPEMPTKEGYTFLGWYFDDAEWNFDKYTVTGNMILDAKWSINFYSVKLNVNNNTYGKASSYSNKYKFDELVKIIAMPYRGYEFVGWYDGEEEVSNESSYIFNMPAKNVIYTAMFKECTNAPYKVEHYLQNIDNDYYPSEPYEIDYLTGTTNELTKAQRNTYEGFEKLATSVDSLQRTIKGDGSTVVYIYYLRDTYQLSLDNGMEVAGTITGAGTYKYGKSITITATTNPGYTFIGWYDGENEISTKSSYTFTMPANNLSYTAKWTINDNVPYKVKHYLENIDDDYFTLFETNNLKGTTGELTEIEPNDYEGFTPSQIVQKEINGDGSTVVNVYYLRNTYQLSLDNGMEVAGTITGAGTYKYNKKITITASPNPGYTFSGWYNGLQKLTDNLTYIFNMPCDDETYIAEWIPNKYKIVIHNSNEELLISGVISGDEYDCGSEIKISILNIPSGFTIRWMRSDNQIYYGNEYSFKMTPMDIDITISIYKPYTKDKYFMYFGKYPQTRISDSSLINQLNNSYGLLPTSTNLNEWKYYNYYISSKITKFMYYKDVDCNEDGEYDYRGVYFTQYRPNDFMLSSSSSHSYQDNNYYYINNIYWFSYDPIEWIIFDESDGQALIVANLLLDSQEFQPEWTNSMTYHNGDSGYANNYELSYIRIWLNNNFYNTAFNSLQKSLIQLTEVDNSNTSTGQLGYNEYLCDNTYDKIFLLSYMETYKFKNDEVRVAYGTDYAKCQGLFVAENGASYWWLRSPSDNSGRTSNYVGLTGKVSNFSVDCIYYGVRPACYINLNY